MTEGNLMAAPAPEGADGQRRGSPVSPHPLDRLSEDLLLLREQSAELREQSARLRDALRLLRAEWARRRGATRGR